MNWLARLKNFENAQNRDATKATKPPFVAFVAVAPGPFQKSGTAKSAPNTKLLGSQKVDLLARLASFRFDLVHAEIEAGYPADNLTRVNNMAWEFMYADGLAFEDAFTAASSIVANTQAAACEAAYVETMWLFDQLRKQQNE